MLPIQAVIFDLDDTLYPERAFAMSAFDAVAVAFKPDLGDPEATRLELESLFETAHRPKIFNELVRRRGLDDSADRLVPAMVETYRMHKPTVALHTDAVVILRVLRESCRLGLITDGHPVMQWNKIDALFLRPRLDEIIVTADIGPEFAKPHTKAFEMMAQCLGVDPQACAYVADNPQKDFIAPNELDWLSVRIQREDGIYRDAAVAPRGEPDCTIVSLRELQDVLQQAPAR